jgi:hypothetical protein
MTALSLDKTLFETFREMLLPSTLGPEKTLMLKVLEDALETFTLDRFSRSRKRESAPTKNRREHEYREARRWIYAEGESEWVFSFVQCCEWLDINPSLLRERCRKYDREIEKGARKPAVRQCGLRHYASRTVGAR